MIAPKIIGYRSNWWEKVVKHTKRCVVFDLLIVPEILPTIRINTNSIVTFGPPAKHENENVADFL